MNPFASIGRKITKLFIAYLSGPSSVVNDHPTHSFASLVATLKPGDVLLVEGKERYSTAVKYFTQSVWSHSALYIGNNKLIEADLKQGVIELPLDFYRDYHTRICRPYNMHPEDIEKVIAHAKAQIGHTYDLKNIFDLARYLFPVPPIPNKWKRKVFEFGSGSPTKVICSSMIAMAFQSVHYPVLPVPIKIKKRKFFKKRLSSKFTPADFDRSPYFNIVKPTLEQGFDYKKFDWHDGNIAQIDSEDV